MFVLVFVRREGVADGRLLLPGFGCSNAPTARARRDTLLLLLLLKGLSRELLEMDLRLGHRNLRLGRRHLMLLLLLMLRLLYLLLLQDVVQCAAGVGHVEKLVHFLKT